MGPEAGKPTYDALSAEQKRHRLLEVAGSFLRLGTIAFGGPAAHIAMMDQEFVGRRQWVSREKLLDLLGITNLIPGPNSTELVMHLGCEQAGWRGLILAGTCFVLPAMGMVWALAILYSHYQTLPQLQALLYGIKPVIIAITLQALGNLGRKAVKDIPTALAVLGAGAGYFSGFSPILLVVGLGAGVMVVKNWQRLSSPLGLIPIPGSWVLAVSSSPPSSVGWLSVLTFFLKIGCVLYGSGYVLLAFLQQDLVERHHWLTSQQLLDAVAIGQFTPGPVFTTATFIGYLLAGNPGAIAATVGIFLPAFFFVWLVRPAAAWLRQSRWASSLLDGVNAASLGLMASVTWVLAWSALVDKLTLTLGVVSLGVLLRWRPNSVWLVLAGGGAGVLAWINK